MNRLFILLGIIFLVFAVIVFFQTNMKTILSVLNRPPASKVTINSSTFKVEVAKSQKEKIIGLSAKQSIPEDQGMLFVFDKADTYPFGTKNMKFPVDIIFINDTKVVSVVENATPPASPESESPIYYPENPCDKVLEINAGLATRDNIKKGDTVQIEIN